MFNKKSCSVFKCRKRDVTWFWIEVKGGLRFCVVACPDHRDAIRSAYGLVILHDQTIKAA
jgi:hypothetical protein